LGINGGGETRMFSTCLINTFVSLESFDSRCLSLIGNDFRFFLDKQHAQQNRTINYELNLIVNARKRKKKIDLLTT